MEEFIALPFPFSSERKLWPFHVAVVSGGTAKKFTKRMMREQSC